VSKIVESERILKESKINLQSFISILICKHFIMCAILQNNVYLRITSARGLIFAFQGKRFYGNFVDPLALVSTVINWCLLSNRRIMYT